METFGLVLPGPIPVKAGAVPSEVVQMYAKDSARFPLLLAAGDFKATQAYWDALGQRSRKEQQTREISRTFAAMHGRNLMLLDRAMQWQAQQPQSAAAQLTLAGAYIGAAFEARGSGYVKNTPSSNFDRMRSRLAMAKPLMEKLLQRQDFFGIAALYLQTRRGLIGGKSNEDWSALQKLMEYAPLDENLYFIAAGHADQRWAGRQSTRRKNALLELATLHRLSEPHLTALKQALDAIDRPPASISNPQAVRPYWLARVGAAPTLQNLVEWMEAEYSVSNWPLLLDITERVHALYPLHRRAWEVRAWALKSMDEPEAAYKAAIAAASTGSDSSMNLIIQAYVRGGLKRPLRDFAGLLAHCQMGAALALPSAANCMGSAHLEGFGGAQIDRRRALAWHLLGARGGHANSAHDVAVLLPQVFTDPALHDDVDAAAGYWLQVAARDGHRIAQNKLAGRPGWGLTCEELRATGRAR